jgi:hypothetical protein
MAGEESGAGALDMLARVLGRPGALRGLLGDHPGEGWGVMVQVEGSLLPVRSARDIVVERCRGDPQGEVPPSGRGTARSLARA